MNFSHQDFLSLCRLPVLLNSFEVLNFKLTTTKNQTNLITNQHRERNEESKGEGMRKGRGKNIKGEREIEKQGAAVSKSLSVIISQNRERESATEWKNNQKVNVNTSHLCPSHLSFISFKALICFCFMNNRCWRGKNNLLDHSS